jgi:Zn-dependent peptidase ImmA (M78 family)/transcriptional regulator with XRE-family HTH domain
MADKQFQLKVNKDVLKWARKSLEYDTSYAAKELKITEKELMQLESGKKSPTYDMLLKMSQLYSRPFAAFLLNEVPEEKPVPKDFRTVKSEKQGHLHDKTLLAIRRVRGLIQDAIELRNELGLKLPVWNYSASINDDPGQLASEYRKLFQVKEINQIEKTDAALDFLISQVESQGILVFQMSLPQDGVRGFSLTDESVPVIVIKRGSERPAAKIFTLFHELGHVLLHDGGICNLKEYGAAGKIEKWCNQFAASILVPAYELLGEEIVKEHRRDNNPFWQLNILTGLGIKRHVGPEVILRVLYNAGLTTKQFYEEKHEKWSSTKPGGRGGGAKRDFLKEKVKEKGKGFTRLALEAWESRKISLKDFADYMDITIDQVKQVPAYL